MKKFLAISVMMVVLTSFVNAQDYKPVSGNLAVEVNFTPLSASPIGLNYLKGRYFFADDMVFRFGLDIRMHSNKSEPVNANNPNVNDEQKMSYSQFGLMPGIEKHFGNWERFSPYIGAEIGFTTKSSKAEYTDNDPPVTTMEIKNAWDGNGTQRGFTTFGLNILAGADFYFVKRMYMGVEIGFGYQATTFKEVEATVGNTTNVIETKENASDVGFNFNPAIRLGFCF